MLNLGKTIVDSTVGAPIAISYGDQSPQVDAVPLAWRVGDRRYPAGPFASYFTLGWVCTQAGTPGIWQPVRQTGTFDLFLSYGGGSASGTLPQPPEASPSFYLRADTDYTVPQSFILSPGAVWEWPVGVAISGGRARLLVHVQSCGLTGTNAYLIVHGSKNGVTNLTPDTPNLDGMNNQLIITDFGVVGITQNDKVGIHVETGGLGSGFLVMTAHLQIFYTTPP